MSDLESKTALLDTSVLVAALVADLPEHDTAAAVMREALAGEHILNVSAHTLAELYSVLTTLPVAPRISPGQAAELIRRNVLAKARVIALGADDYEAVFDRMMRLGLSGGAIYDVLQVRAAEQAHVDRLYTFNGRDFRRMLPSPPTELVVL